MLDMMLMMNYLVALVVPEILIDKNHLGNHLEMIQLNYSLHHVYNTENNSLWTEYSRVHF